MTVGRGPVTLLDVAREAGVSLATASRVINGSQRKVSAELRARVSAAAETLKYVPNAYAQALARSRTSIAGVIVPDIGHPYFAGILRGIQCVANDVGQIVLICNSNREPARELEYLALLHEHRAATIILATTGLDDSAYVARVNARLEAFIDGGGRAAIIGRQHIDVAAVVPDNRGGMRMLGEELVRLGHRSFAVISGPPHVTTTEDRVGGLRDALAAAGIELPPRAIVDGAFRRDSGEGAVEDIYARGLAPTAIVALNDEMAVGALTALRQRGFRVPEDVSLTGFDDIPIAADVVPALTTVHVPLEELGERAMRLALQPEPAGLSEPVATRLVVRDSTAPPTLL